MKRGGEGGRGGREGGGGGRGGGVGGGVEGGAKIQSVYKPPIPFMVRNESNVTIVVL